MKKISMIASLAFLWSCGNSAPKCDDPQVIETVKKIVAENAMKMMMNFSTNADSLSVDRIMTKSKDNDLKICGCEGVLKNTSTIWPEQAVVKYEAQENPDGEIIVKINDVIK